MPILKPESLLLTACCLLALWPLQAGLAQEQASPQAISQPQVVDSVSLKKLEERTKDSIRRRELDSLKRRKLNTFDQDTADREWISIDKRNLDEYRLRRRFQYEEKKKEGLSPLDHFFLWIGRFIEWFFEWLFGKEVSGEYFQLFLKYLPYGLLLVLALLVLRFFGRNARPMMLLRRRNGSRVYMSEEEALMEESDLGALQREALEAEDFRLALRYGFLGLLKALRQGGLIQWMAQKTNQEYLTETRETELYPKFREAIRWYEYTWYGEFQLDRYHYERAMDVFEEIHRQIPEE